MHPVTLCCLSFMEAYYVDMRTCRLFPITFATSRRIAKDIELFGYHIPAGVTVFVVFHSSLYVFFISQQFQTNALAHRLMPKIYRRRLGDSAVELRRVGRCVLNSQLSSRRFG